MNKIDLGKIFKLSRENVVRPTSFWPSNYYRDWIIIVIIFTVCLLSLSFFSWRIYLSDQLGGGYIQADNRNISIVKNKIDKKKLKEVLTLLEARDSKLISIKINRPKMIDPSL
jgi:hypothetical protein